MTRAYLRLDPLYDERKSHYPDGPYAALIACLCLGESQPERGRFRSLSFLKALLDNRGKHVRFLIEHGDLAVLDDGRLYIQGWDEWQEGDWKVTERVQRIRSGRNARRNGHRGAGVTVDVTVPVTAHRYGSNTLREESGRRSVSESGAPLLSDDETREHLDRLRGLLSDIGALPTKPTPAELQAALPDDETIIARCQAILVDETAPDWRRDAARTQLELMGVR